MNPTERFFVCLNWLQTNSKKKNNDSPLLPLQAHCLQQPTSQDTQRPSVFFVNILKILSIDMILLIITYSTRNSQIKYMSVVLLSGPDYMFEDAFYKRIFYIILSNLLQLFIISCDCIYSTQETHYSNSWSADSSGVSVCPKLTKIKALTSTKPYITLRCDGTSEDLLQGLGVKHCPTAVHLQVPPTERGKTRQTSLCLLLRLLFILHIFI